MLTNNHKQDYSMHTKNLDSTSPNACTTHSRVGWQSLKPLRKKMQFLWPHPA